MERVGHFGDGGKWICVIFQYAAFDERPLIVYSFGVDEDSSFEAELVDRTSAHIYAFDYSVDNMGPKVTNGTNSKVKFSRIGLGGCDETVDSNHFMTLPSIMSELGHDYVNILKIDVEGAEFDALDVLIETYNGSSLPKIYKQF
jgi:FkbM family methyltransferase